MVFYDIENKQALDASLNIYDNFRKNIENIQDISNHALEYLKNPLYDVLFEAILIDIKEWPESNKTGNKDWTQLSKDSEIRKSLNLWLLSFVENDDHFDLATYLGDIYTVASGMKHPLHATHAFYPPWQEGITTQSSSLRLTDEIREELMKISDLELLSEDWISIPWTRKQSVKADETPNIWIDTWPMYMKSIQTTMHL